MTIFALFPTKSAHFSPPTKDCLVLALSQFYSFLFQFLDIRNTLLEDQNVVNEKRCVSESAGPVWFKRKLDFLHVQRIGTFMFWWASFGIGFGFATTIWPFNSGVCEDVGECLGIEESFGNVEKHEISRIFESFKIYFMTMISGDFKKIHWNYFNKQKSNKFLNVFRF